MQKEIDTTETCCECNEPATTVAEHSKTKEVGKYCDKHAREAVDARNPEYHVSCPNCGCDFGVNWWKLYISMSSWFYSKGKWMFRVTNENTEDTFLITDDMEEAVQRAKEIALWSPGDLVTVESEEGFGIRQFWLDSDGVVSEIICEWPK